MIYVLVVHDTVPRAMARVVLRDTGTDYERFDYDTNEWVDGLESWFRNCMNSNDYEPITEQEAKQIITQNGGKFKI